MVDDTTQDLENQEAKNKQTSPSKKDEILSWLQQELLASELDQFQKKFGLDWKYITHEDIITTYREPFEKYLRSKNRTELSQWLKKIRELHDAWEIKEDEFIGSLPCAWYASLADWCNDYVHKSLNETWHRLMYVSYIDAFSKKIDDLTWEKWLLQDYLVAKWLPTNYKDFLWKDWHAWNDGIYLRLLKHIHLFPNTLSPDQQDKARSEIADTSITIHDFTTISKRHLKYIWNWSVLRFYNQSYVQQEGSKTVKKQSAKDFGSKLSELLGKIHTATQDWVENDELEELEEDLGVDEFDVNLAESEIFLAKEVLDVVVLQWFDQEYRVMESLKDGLRHRWFYWLFADQKMWQFLREHPKAIEYKKTMPESARLSSLQKTKIQFVSDAEYDALQYTIIDEYINRAIDWDEQLGSLFSQIQDLETQWIWFDDWRNEDNPDDIQQLITQAKQERMDITVKKKLDSLERKWVLDLFVTQIWTAEYSAESLKKSMIQFISDYYDPSKLVIEIPWHKTASWNTPKIHFYEKDLRFPVLESWTTVSNVKEFYLDDVDTWWVEFVARIDPHKSDQVAYMMLQQIAWGWPVLYADVDRQEDKSIKKISNFVVEGEKYSITSTITWAVKEWYPVTIINNIPWDDIGIQNVSIAFVDEEEAENAYLNSSWILEMDINQLWDDVLVVSSHWPSATITNYVFEQIDAAKSFTIWLRHDPRYLPEMLNQLFVANHLPKTEIEKTSTIKNTTKEQDVLDNLMWDIQDDALETKQFVWVAKQDELIHQTLAYFDLSNEKLLTRQNKHISDFTSRNDDVFQHIMDRYVLEYMKHNTSSFVTKVPDTIKSMKDIDLIDDPILRDSILNQITTFKWSDIYSDAENKHWNDTVAYVIPGEENLWEIHFRASKFKGRIDAMIQDYLYEKGIEDSSPIDMDLEFRIHDNNLEIQQTWKKWKDIESFFDDSFVRNIPYFENSTDETVEEAKDYFVRRQEKSLDQMRRHEETHRILEYFWVSYLEWVTTVTWEKITLSEEDLCRIAEQNFWTDRQLTDRSMIVFKTENWVEVELSLDQVNRSLSSELNKKIDTWVSIPNSLRDGFIDTNKDAWFQLLNFDDPVLVGGSYRQHDTSNVSQIGTLMSEVYDENTFASLYAASTPEMTQAKNAIKQQISWFQSHWWEKSQWIWTNVDQEVWNLTEHISSVQKKIGNWAWSLADATTFVAAKNKSLFWRNWLRNQLTELVRWNSDMSIASQIRYLEWLSGEGKVAAAPLIAELKWNRDALELQLQELDVLKPRIEAVEKTMKDIEATGVENVTSFQKEALQNASKELWSKSDMWKNIQEHLDAITNTDSEEAIDEAVQEAEQQDSLSENDASSEVNKREFAESFRRLKWQELDFHDWIQIYFRARPSLHLWGWNAWLKWKIIDKWDTYDIEINWATEWSLWWSRTFTRHKTVDDLVDLKSRFWWEIYVMPKEWEIWNISQAAQWISWTAGSAWFSSFWATWSNARSWESILDPSWERLAYSWTEGWKRWPDEIKYLWYAMPWWASYDYYQIDKGGDWVQVKAITWEYIFDRFMDWTTFSLWVSDKALVPLTEQEYQSTKDGPDMWTNDEKTETSRTDHFMSFTWVVLALKKLPEAFKSYAEQRDQYQAAKLYARLASPLKHIDFYDIGDVWYDAQTEFDQQIWSVIQKYKGRLSNDDDRDWVHKNKNFTRVYNEIFLKRSLSDERYRQKAAWYLLWTLETGNMYWRDLSHHKWEATWVWAILWEDHRKKFLIERKRMEAMLKNNNWEDEEIRNNLINLEIQYLADMSIEAPLNLVFGSKFWKAVEAFTEDSPNQFEKNKSWIDKKSSFDEIYKTVEWWIPKLECAKVVAWLGIMVERAEYPHHYFLVNKIIVQIFASGMVANNMDNFYTGKLKQIWRTFGIPMLLLAKDQNSQSRVINILDAIATQKNFETISWGAMHLSWPPEDINMHNFTEISAKKSWSDDYKWSRHAKWVWNIWSWFDSHGNDIMNSINMKDTALLQAMDKDVSIFWWKRDDLIKKDIEKFYFSKIHDGERKSESAVNKDTFKWWDNPAYSEGILNLSPWWFKWLLLDVYNASDNRLRDSNAEARRESLTYMVQRLEWQANGAWWEYILHLVTKKFIDYFKWEFLDKELYYFQKALYKGDGEQASKRINQMTWWKWRKRYSRNGLISRWFDAFKNFFRKHGGRIGWSLQWWLMKKNAVLVDNISPQPEWQHQVDFDFMDNLGSKNNKNRNQLNDDEYDYDYDSSDQFIQ